MSRSLKLFIGANIMLALASPVSLADTTSQITPQPNATSDKVVVTTEASNNAAIARDQQRDMSPGERAEAIATTLQLTEAQRPAWDALAMMLTTHDHAGLPNLAPIKDPSLGDLLDRKIMIETAVLDHDKQVDAALHSFEGLLTPNQKVLLRQSFLETMPHHRQIPLRADGKTPQPPLAH